MSDAPYHLAVVASRQFSDDRRFRAAVEKLVQPMIDAGRELHIHHPHDGYMGRTVLAYCREKGLESHSHFANWAAFGRDAARRRAEEMLEQCHGALVFHIPESFESAAMIAATEEAENPIQLRVIHVEYDRDVFVFGSNLKGIHGAGAALHAAKSWGAQIGKGEGAQGQAYALPTKLTPNERMDLETMRKHVGLFLTHAYMFRGTRFLLTKVGCGLAGHSEQDVAPMFASAPPNVHLVDDSGQVICPASQWHTQQAKAA